jgi:hypothetical protein
MYGSYSSPLSEYFLVVKEISFSHSRENYGRVLWVNFFQFNICSNTVFTRPPISLCLPTSSEVNYPFFEPPTQTLCEEILCQN